MAQMQPARPTEGARRSLPMGISESMSDDAQRLLDEGDVEGAIRSLDTLPDPARVVLAPWLASAERRVEIDRHVAAVRADALAGLAQVSRAAP